MLGLFRDLVGGARDVIKEWSRSRAEKRKAAEERLRFDRLQDEIAVDIDRLKPQEKERSK